MKNKLAVHMRYHFFLHYGWFLQNLGKDFIPSIMHTTVGLTLDLRTYFGVPTFVGKQTYLSNKSN